MKLIKAALIALAIFLALSLLAISALLLWERSKFWDGEARFLELIAKREGHLSEHFPGDWDRVCVAGPYEPLEDGKYTAAPGFDLDTGMTYVPEGSWLLIFLDDETKTGKTLLMSSWQKLGLGCVNRDAATFRAGHPKGRSPFLVIGDRLGIDGT